MEFVGDPEQAVDLDAGGSRARAGFRFTDASDVAGGPIEVEFFVEVTDPRVRYLLVTGDRMRQRPGGFQFVASFEGTALDDPYGAVPDMGGPAGVVEVGASRPWRQPLILNQFIRLEAVTGLLPPGASGRLKVECRRPVRLAAGRDEALASTAKATLVEVTLGLKLVRDDARLAVLVKQLIAQVRDGPRDRRESALALLVTLRAPMAVEQWRVLENHPDPLVARRVQSALRLAVP
jgi:hypothetical protein